MLTSTFSTRYSEGRYLTDREREGFFQHFSKYCRVLNSCRYCHKVVLVSHLISERKKKDRSLSQVSNLTDHYVERCDFLGTTKKHCKKCGLATDKEDEAEGHDHPMCRSEGPSPFPQYPSPFQRSLPPREPAGVLSVPSPSRTTEMAGTVTSPPLTDATTILVTVCMVSLLPTLP